MSQLAYTLTDSATMLRRELKRLLRYPSMTVLLVGMPVVFLLLFVYVFGGQLGTGLGGGHSVGHASRTAYLNFIVPGILLMTVAAAANGRAVLVAMDMTEGIIARFRTMAIARASVLTGHVLGSVIQALLGVTVVIGIALALGFRPTAGPLHGSPPSASWPCSPSRSPGSPSRSASPPRASKRPATPPWSSPCCPSSAAASSPSPACRQDSASSPATNPSHP